MVYCVYVRVEWCSFDNFFDCVEINRDIEFEIFYLDELVCSKEN